MGAVYEAENTWTKRRVATKVLRERTRREIAVSACTSSGAVRDAVARATGVGLGGVNVQAFDDTVLEAKLYPRSARTLRPLPERRVPAHGVPSIGLGTASRPSGATSFATTGRCISRGLAMARCLLSGAAHNRRNTMRRFSGLGISTLVMLGTLAVTSTKVRAGVGVFTAPALSRADRLKARLTFLDLRLRDPVVAQKYRDAKRRNRVGSKTLAAVSAAADTGMGVATAVGGFVLNANGHGGMGISAISIGAGAALKSGVETTEKLKALTAARQQARSATLESVSNRLTPEQRATFERAGWLAPRLSPGANIF